MAEAAPTYTVRAGWVLPTWTEINSKYTWAQLAGAFTWDELAAGEIDGADVLAIQIRRTLADMFNPLQLGRAEIKLLNDTGEYSPDNTSSPHSLQINQVVSVKAITVNNSVYGLFSGFADGFELDSQIGRRFTVARASDISRFLRNTVTTSLFVDTKMASLTNAVMSEVVLGPNRFQVSSGMSDTVPFAFLNNIPAAAALDQILKTGAHFSFVDGSGNLQVKERNFELFLTIQNSYVNDAYTTKYSLDDRVVFNDILTVGQAREPKSSVTSIGFVSDNPTVPGSGILAFFLEFIDPDSGERAVPVRSLATLVISQDYLLNTKADGTGTDQTSTASISITPFATTALVSVFNGDGTEGFLTKFQLRGDPIQKQASFIGQQQDTASQDIFGRRTLTVESELMEGVVFADQYAKFLLSRLANPLADISVSQRNKFPDIVQYDLTTQLHVVDSLSGVSSDFRISELVHAISFETVGLSHRSEWRLGLKNPGEAFFLDVSKLDVGRLLF